MFGFAESFSFNAKFWFCAGQLGSQVALHETFTDEKSVGYRYRA